MPAFTIKLTGLRVYGWHGVREAEKLNGQEFVIDVVLDVDAENASNSDDLADTVDYDALTLDLKLIVSGEPVQLLETLANRLIERCLGDPRVESARVTVHKPAAPIDAKFDDVAVTMARQRRPPL